MTVYVDEKGQGSSNRVTLSQLNKAWTESQVTWDDWQTGLSWTDPGADRTTSRKAIGEGFFPCNPTATHQSLTLTTSVQNSSNREPNQGRFCANAIDNNGMDYEFGRSPGQRMSIL